MLKIKLNLLKIKRTILIKGGASNVVKIANLSKFANNVALNQLKLVDANTDDTASLINSSNTMIDSQDAFIGEVEKSLKEVFHLNKKEVDRVMDEVSVPDLMAFVNYVYGRMNGATDEDFEQAPKD
ncbi:phage tail assembly chaperone [Lactobacillus delbrueckii]|uniref:Phage tail assembly chaperone n=1 Tax=Lactobacillus delbrueckii subsp. allosunkii TaxID=1050107 RepID=A0ABD4SCT2_9LACO|nr:phage tail assembly chaperone [Lactobacillus delbrueckii]MCD5446171.1 phage tail assembly chaperone [Lactobacillus delbrueckii subsp. lactis]MCD5517402.1 phage tail assembly chaperone [Lactobacillus delbrueckii subsp. sunkii]MCT3475653.1 hypothetical protein [Lactobacillus delbrueckii subsp. lactis]MCZ0776436.1 phage tail assembly chaperone [Lactobacillus delbrueckii subsp. sunkii]MCZ0793543.1 phage tail assembly chaperone [Lactobacillus delbrueckii]